MDAGYLLVLVLVVTFSVPGCKYESLGNTGVPKDLDNVEAVLDELSYIDHKEKVEGIKKQQSREPDDDPWITICDTLDKEEIVVLPEEDYKAIVEEKLKCWNVCLGKWLSYVTYAQWNYETDMTEENNKESGNIEVLYSKWDKQLSRNARAFLADERSSSLDADSIRQLRLLAFSTVPSDEESMRNLSNVKMELQNIYSGAKVGVMKLEPDLTDIMAKSRDNAELLEAWTLWRNATGPLMRNKYTEMVKLLNKGAQDNGFDSYADAWMYEQFDGTDDIEALSERLWAEIKPLYEQLHAYVRNKLSDKYGNDGENNEIFQKGGIPAHLTGNMWGQEWGEIYDTIKPYPDVQEPDYNQVMQDRNYTVDDLFSLAEDFYVSIGLDPMTKKFNDKSMKERPSDGRQVVCHASATDFYNDNDFRIKMCTEVNMAYFETIHHEMGHIEYFMSYKNQPTIYRDGANSAFHEAVGDTISLAVLTEKHLNTVLGKHDVMTSRSNEQKEKRDINYLMKRALYKIAFLPFGYMIDKWRWDVFNNVTKKTDYNKDWWKLRLKYQGIVSPVQRDESNFDPGAKFHIPSNSPYICYFVSFISQFQFYESMCDASGHTGPLHECDFYKSKVAGEKLNSMLSLGKSKHWPEAMEHLTGSRNISTSSIRKYFAPLEEWLIEENKRSGTTVGWKHATINWPGDMDEREKSSHFSVSELKRLLDLLTRINQ